jgi:hypothetical protein
MKRLLALVCLCLAAAAFAERPARVTLVENERLAQAIVSGSLGTSVTADDARVVQTGTWLKEIATRSGEDDKAIAAQCERTSRWFFDLTRTRATPLEMLEALALLGKAGTPIQDTLRDYIAGRRATAGKTHREGLAAAGVKSALP